MFASKDVFQTASSGPYTIGKSVRLRSSASAYFNRTLTTPTNNKIWTFSCWFKRGQLTYGASGASGALFFAPSSGSTFAGIYFTPTDIINWYDANGGATVYLLQTTQVFRDPSAWYHLVCVYDSTQATAANRQKMYVNGVQITAFSTASYVAQNTDGRFNSAVSHVLGQTTAATQYLDGYLTEINFIDGQALTPSSFGETDSITGVWKAKKYSGTYGTNGFYLNFSDNSSNTSTTIGKDYSGNGNNWTPNNISVTSGVTYDSMVDSPTVSAVSSNYCVLNPLQPASTTVVVPTDGNLKMTGTASGNNVTGTMAIGTTTYFEGTVITGGGTVEFGVKNLDTGNTYVYDSNGNKYLAGTGTAYGATFTTSDIIGVAVDPTNLTLQFYKNGTSQGVISSAFPSGNYVPFFYASNTNASAANFGQRPFSYTPPTGFVALNTYNLPASTITNGAAYMNAVARSGTGATATVAIAFQPDMIWSKCRSNVVDHNLFDSVRGFANDLFPNLTLAEDTTNVLAVTTSSTGYGFGSSNSINGSGRTYVDWVWKAGGTSSSNTNGSITSTVSVGATQGFSVATFTSPALGAFTVGHGLGVAPAMVIMKPRNNSLDSWVVYHKNSNATPQSYFLLLNSTAAAANSTTIFNNTAPTSTVVSFTAAVALSASATAVMYSFAEVKGFSAFGSYTANASADGPFIYTGFRPRWIMLKRSSAAGAPWSMFDTSRNTYNSTNLELDANASSAESTSGNGMDILSNGFKLRDSVYLNSSSGDTFIYAAFAENPFKNSLAR